MDVEVDVALGGEPPGTCRLCTCGKAESATGAAVLSFLSFRGETLRARLRRGDSLCERFICHDATFSLAACVLVLSLRERVVRAETILLGRVRRIDPVRRDSKLTASQFSALTRFWCAQSCRYTLIAPV